MPKDFSRDLGYLDKFLQGLRAHAATLGDPAGSRLSALLDAEDRAWGEIRGILVGETASAQPATPRSAAAETAPAPAAPEVKPAPEPPFKRLTVGSLISKS